MKTVLSGIVALSLLNLGCSGLLPHGVSKSSQALTWSTLKRQIRTEFPKVQHISTEQLTQWMAEAKDSQPLLLDVRQIEEYEVSHLKGAQRAETLADAQTILTSVPKDQLIVLYCSVGYRSSALAKALEAEEYTQVYNLEGSLFAWANEGRPVYQGEQPVQHVHPYDNKWGQLLNLDLWPKE